MRRWIARHSTWWMRAFVVAVILTNVIDMPGRTRLAIYAVLLVLAFVRPRPLRDRSPERVAAPVLGRWTALNSPATKVPSHGIRAYGQTHAIDVLHPRPPELGEVPRWRNGMRSPEVFPTFGAPVFAMADGCVVRSADGQRDHRSRESWQALLYLMTVEATCRELGGARFILGYHLVVDHGGGVVAAYAHLRRGSQHVAVGDRVQAGQPLAEVGNSGNTSEPHLHVQLMDDPVVTAAAGVPFRWSDIGILAGEGDDTFVSGEVSSVVVEGLPADGQVFVAFGR